MKNPPTKTDNFEISKKIYLRREGTEHLKDLCVLDLFAGENKLWKSFEKNTYYGIEIEKGKGKNVTGDNLKVIPSLDLSRFNVIDCDAYGIPCPQINALFRNGTMQPGTVVFYTAIRNGLSGQSKDLTKELGIEDMYKKAPTLFKNVAFDAFYHCLFRHGIRTVHEYEVQDRTFMKKYGYFVYVEQKS